MGSEIVFADRREAGRKLAEHMSGLRGRSDLLVLGLPRGGLPVAAEVARALDAPLDAFMVRKLGVPGHEELAMGAIASGGIRVVNPDVVGPLRIAPETIDFVAEQEGYELERRESLYREGRPPPEVGGRTVILVDDGLATGSTMRAAAAAIRTQRPARVIVAVPIGAPETCEAMEKEVDEVICLQTPDPMYAVGGWYEDFSATTDEEVRSILEEFARPEASGPAGADASSSPENPGPAGAGGDGGTVATIRRAAQPLTGGPHDYDRLLEAIGDSRVVLIGDASHGTHEFYRERARITKRLIEEKGFRGVAVEADWPDAARVNRFVQGRGEDAEAIEALADFRRFPAWMWRNADVLDFVGWLREYNDAQPDPARKAGFHGLDLYGLFASIQAVVRYLDRVDPATARQARSLYGCFDATGDDAQRYGWAVAHGGKPSCEEEVVRMLTELRRKASQYAMRDGWEAEDEQFHAEQNARVIANAEAYYREMYRGDASSWNMRDAHMGGTLEALVAHLGRGGPPAKVVVWAHNSHLGDARATDMSRRGELNLGQLVRERWPDSAAIVGFTSYDGTVSAASDWGEPVERMRVRPALEGSVEDLFHRTGHDRFLLDLTRESPATRALEDPLLERFIGVIYRPQTERWSHYYACAPAGQYDLIVHIDRTRALEPLERTSFWIEGEAPETYPTAY